MDIMDFNDDLTIQARCLQWEIFNPDWHYLSDFPAQAVSSLTAQSVGLHPYFADPAWVFTVALPYFEGELNQDFDPPSAEEAADDASRCLKLKEFLKRIHIVVGNLAPRGELVTLDDGVQCVGPVVKCSDFVAFAIRKGWSFPPELLAMNLNRRPELVALPTQSNAPLTKLEKQHRAILDVINTKQYEPLAIPDGGKGLLETICKADYPVLFDTESSFSTAWKQGKHLFRMANHASFAKRGK
jgi:hypothetical protein